VSLHKALCFAALLLPATAWAQTPAPRTVVQPTDVAAMIAHAQAQPEVPLISQNLVGVGSYYRANLDYRHVTPAQIHDKENELMLVIQGSGTLTMGGSLVDAKRSNPTNSAGSSISGGTPYRMTAGAAALVPAGVAHQIVPDAGTAIIVMTFHTPATGP